MQIRSIDIFFALGQAEGVDIKAVGFQKPGLPAEVNFPLTMAPMVGLSHCAFRQMVREYLPRGAVTLWPSEMLNSRRLPNEKLQNIPEAMRFECENFWVPQILANEEEKIRLSLQKLYDFGAQGIDINMGCPVQKALKHNYGVSLMGDSDYAAKVVEVTKKYARGPISVKLRAAPPDQESGWLSFLKKLEAAGADWITLHPRTAEQKRKGSADWSQVQKLKNELKIPVIGNGDVQIAEDVLNFLDQGECDMVMAGRVLTARPWLFWQLGHKLGWPNPLGREGNPPVTPEEEAKEYGRSLLRLLELMELKLAEPLALRKFQFHVKNGSIWLPFGHTLYSEMTKAKTFQGARDTVTRFFSVSHRMYKKTELRQ